GKEFGLDFADENHGKWDAKHTKLTITTKDTDPLAVREVWDDFSERNQFIQKAKEIVLRTFRDGEMFLRMFEKNGKITLRMIEPEKIGWTQTTYDTPGAVQPDDIDEDDIYATLTEDMVGQPTKVNGGIEFLKDDAEVIVAYHIRYGSNINEKPTRVPAKDIIHTKPLADSNDLRGIPLLEVIAKNLTNYTLWEEYRIVLNRVRTAVAFVRQVEGTSAQANTLLMGRQSPRPQPQGREPVVTNARREAAFQ